MKKKFPLFPWLAVLLNAAAYTIATFIFYGWVPGIIAFMVMAAAFVSGHMFAVQFFDYKKYLQKAFEKEVQRVSEELDREAENILGPKPDPRNN